MLKVKDEKTTEYPVQFNKDGSHDLKKVARFESYKGFLFGSLNADVQPLQDFLGETKVIIDQIVDQLRPLLVRELQVHIPPHHVDLALKEAAARAEITGVPALWFPELAREKLAEAQAWWIRQQRVRTLSAVSFAA